MDSKNSQQSPKLGYTNGARARIVGALGRLGILTHQEVAQETGLTTRQVVDNVRFAREAGLVRSSRDETTNEIVNQITAEGRKWLLDRQKSGKSPLLEEPHQDDAIPAVDSPESDPTVEPPSENLPEAPAASTESSEVSRPLDPEQKPEIYAIEDCNGNLEIFRIDRQAAIALAMEKTIAANQPHEVYQLLRVGVSRATVVVDFFDGP